MSARAGWAELGRPKANPWFDGEVLQCFGGQVRIPTDSPLLSSPLMSRLGGGTQEGSHERVRSLDSPSRLRIPLHSMCADCGRCAATYYNTIKPIPIDVDYSYIITPPPLFGRPDRDASSKEQYHGG